MRAERSCLEGALVDRRLNVLKLEQRAGSMGSEATTALFSHPPTYDALGVSLAWLEPGSPGGRSSRCLLVNADIQLPLPVENVVAVQRPHSNSGLSRCIRAPPL
jgi:hypothetical protein